MSAEGVCVCVRLGSKHSSHSNRRRLLWSTHFWTENVCCTRTNCVKNVFVFHTHVLHATSTWSSANGNDRTKSPTTCVCFYIDLYRVLKSSLCRTFLQFLFQDRWYCSWPSSFLPYACTDANEATGTMIKTFSRIFFSSLFHTVSLSMYSAGKVLCKRALSTFQSINTLMFDVDIYLTQMEQCVCMCVYLEDFYRHCTLYFFICLVSSVCSYCKDGGDWLGCLFF